jgi:hypothetical protein
MDEGKDGLQSKLLVVADFALEEPLEGGDAGGEGLALGGPLEFGAQFWHGQHYRAGIIDISFVDEEEDIHRGAGRKVILLRQDLQSGGASYRADQWWWPRRCQARRCTSW